MKKIIFIFLNIVGVPAFSQDLQSVTQNGNSTNLGINVYGSSQITGLNFTAANAFTKQIQAEGHNFWLSTGMGDAKLLIPYNNSANARFENFGLTVDHNIGIGTTSPLARLDVRGGGILVKNLINVTGESVPMLTQSLAHGSFTTFGTSINSSTENEGMNSYALQFLTQESYHTGLIEKLRISANGNVGIGTTIPKEKLSVNGKIRAHEVKVETSGWPDYVFEDEYEVTSLAELEKFIKANKHLPEVPSAKEVEKNGVELGEMNKILLKKIEELTLLLIEKEKELLVESEKNKKQDERLLILEKFIFK